MEILNIFIWWMVLASYPLQAQSKDGLPDRPMSEVEPTVSNTDSNDMFHIFFEKDKELIVLQLQGINTTDLEITLWNSKGEKVATTILYQASTIAFFETETLYAGMYDIVISNGLESIRRHVTIEK